MTRPPPIVDLAWTAAHRRSVVLCDVRWYLDGRSGWSAYAGGHIPGAVFIDLDRWLAAPPSPAAGRHPLPVPDVFATGMRRAGISNGMTVVAYDDAGGATAARLVWMLRACGEPASLLDGGIASWTAPLSTVPAVVTAGRFGLSSWPDELLADATRVAATVAGGGVLVDARAGDRFRGEVEPVDPRAGHIPGAVNLPFAGNLDPSTGRFLDPSQLRKRFIGSGVGDHTAATVYCGSGVTACQVLLAIEHAGLPAARLYPGSWSQWSADPARLVAVGDDVTANADIDQDAPHDRGSGGVAS